MMKLSLLAVVTLAAVLLVNVWSVEARYLPTRSDSSRKEHVREIIKALLELAAEDSDSDEMEAKRSDSSLLHQAGGNYLSSGRSSHRLDKRSPTNKIFDGTVLNNITP